MGKARAPCGEREEGEETAAIIAARGGGGVKGAREKEMSGARGDDRWFWSGLRCPGALPGRSGCGVVVVRRPLDSKIKIEHRKVAVSEVLY